MQQAYLVCFSVLLLSPLIFAEIISNPGNQDKEQNDVASSSQARSIKLTGILDRLKFGSARGASFIGRTISTIPFRKIALATGALLSLFFIFIRLLVVLGPILILGAMTRESSEATDVLRMLIDFYNQVIVALDDQQMLQAGPN